jgi:3-oxoadipate enol-lactonase
MWAEHLCPLAECGHRVVALDLPGFGEARIGPGEQAPWVDVLKAMDALGIDRAAVVGCSFGGAVALRVAAVASERVWALGLVSAPAPGLAPSAELEAGWEKEEAALARGDIEAAVEAVVDNWTLPDAPDALRRRVAEMQRRAFDRQAEAEDATEAADPLEDPEGLAAIEAPTLVAVGEFDKSDFLEGARLLAEALPVARLEVIEGAGHLAPLETPAVFRELVVAWLREHSPPAATPH